jgi:hypothetical protein
MGSDEDTVTRTVASPLPTRLPTEYLFRPLIPSMGERMVQ